MNAFRIPPQDAEFLVKLCNLPQDDLRELFEALNSVPAGLFIANSLVAAAKPVLKKHDLHPKKLVQIAQALCLTKGAQPDMSEADFVTAVFDQVALSIPTKDINEQNLQVVVVNIISMDNLRLSTKATELAYENEKYITGSRILTDIRPVFDGTRTVIQGLFVAYSLSIEYACGQESDKTYFLSMDENDLDELEQAIAGARLQAKAISSLLGSTGTPLLEKAK